MTSSHYPAETIAILLFGSSARGDADTASDRDVCVFVDTTPFTRFIEIRKELGDAIGQEPDSLSIYLAETAIRMARRGSLFIHHLAQEAKLLYDRDSFTPKLFHELHAFDGYAHELASYAELFADVKATCETGLLECDLHVLQMLIRNVSILLCNASNTPTYGRTSAYRNARTAYPSAPFDDSVFEELTAWHLLYCRNVGSSRSLPSMARQREYLANVANLLAFCRETTQ